MKFSMKFSMKFCMKMCMKFSMKCSKKFSMKLSMQNCLLVIYSTKNVRKNTSKSLGQRKMRYFNNPGSGSNSGSDPIPGSVLRSLSPTFFGFSAIFCRIFDKIFLILLLRKTYVPLIIFFSGREKQKEKTKICEPKICFYDFFRSSLQQKLNQWCFAKLDEKCVTIDGIKYLLIR